MVAQEGHFKTVFFSVVEFQAERFDSVGIQEKGQAIPLAVKKMYIFVIHQRKPL